MPFPTTGILDDFNRANENPITGWTNVQNGLEIVTNQCEGTASGGSYNWGNYNVATYGPDAEAFMTIVQTPGSGGCGVYLRATTHVLGTTDGYWAWYAHANGTGSELRAYRMDNGVFTQLGASVAQVLANGNKLGGEIIGSTLKVYYNTGSGWTEALSRTDTTYTAAGYVGLRVFSDVNPMDDFGGGTVVAGAGRTTKNTDQYGLGIAPGVSRMIKAGVGM